MVGLCEGGNEPPGSLKAKSLYLSARHYRDPSTPAHEQPCYQGESHGTRHYHQQLISTYKFSGGPQPTLHCSKSEIWERNEDEGAPDKKTE
ncbi:hypothetical protein ANN_21147 [Periplaneta americana]|uniref:Uncharacterized protein n=1 Tax=Periplaneta americana TaxID=6978 RepID=A0ABQ8SFP0_PERAM|nr:hypothetical protein ANN_21147 [Periplaneta americana]